MTSVCQHVYHQKYIPNAGLLIIQVYINMQRIQNLQKFQVDPSKEAKKTVEDPDLANKGDKKQKSVPKFNRKGDVRLSEKKRSIDMPLNQQRISYISPGKNIGIQSLSPTISGIESPTFSDVMRKFSIANGDLFKFSKDTPSGNDHKLPLEDQRCQSQKCKKICFQKDNKIKELKSKNEKLKEENDYQKECIQVLKQKLNQCQFIQVFLLERQTFISQILQSNIKLNQNLFQNQEAKKALEANLSLALEEKRRMVEQYENKMMQLVEQNQNMYEEIERYAHACIRLEQEVALRHKSHKHSRKTRQNNQNMNKINIKKIAKQSKCDQELSELKTQLKSDVQFTPHDLNIVDRPSQMSIQSCQIEQKQNFEDSQSHEITNNGNHNNKIIKHLQQKIRYSEIQIDVLKKIKQDSSKINKDNDHLKYQNRKLLNRISYLTRNFSRRDNSDSSLQLSLSPKRQ